MAKSGVRVAEAAVFMGDAATVGLVPATDVRLFLRDDQALPVGSFQKSAGRPDLAACLCRLDARDQGRVA